MANWSANEYTVTLDVNGGTLPADASTTIDVTYDVQYTLPTPTKTGYTFLGWFSGSTQYESGAWSGLSDVTLTASWQANSYTVTYEDTNKQKTSITVTYKYNYSGLTDKTVTLTNGQKLKYPNTPIREGYVFTGWYTNSACTTKYTFSGNVTDDMILYLKPLIEGEYPVVYENSLPEIITLREIL